MANSMNVHLYEKSHKDCLQHSQVWRHYSAISPLALISLEASQNVATIWNEQDKAK